jgi:hypothetical protein
MISRLMLSLKKASRITESGWTFDALSKTHARTVTQMEFGHPPDGLQDSGGTTSDEVALSDLSDKRVKGEGSEEDA